MRRADGDTLPARGIRPAEQLAEALRRLQDIDPAGHGWVRTVSGRKAANTQPPRGLNDGIQLRQRSHHQAELFTGVAGRDL